MDDSVRDRHRKLAQLWDIPVMRLGSGFTKEQLAYWKSKSNNVNRIKFSEVKDQIKYFEDKIAATTVYKRYDPTHGQISYTLLTAIKFLEDTGWIDDGIIESMLLHNTDAFKRFIDAEYPHINKKK